MTQNKEYIEQHGNFGRVRAVPRLCGVYPGICLTTEEKKARKNLNQGKCIYVMSFRFNIIIFLNILPVFQNVTFCLEPLLQRMFKRILFL